MPKSPSKDYLEPGLLILERRNFRTSSVCGNGGGGRDAEQKREKVGVELGCFRETSCLTELPSQASGELPAI